LKPGPPEYEVAVTKVEESKKGLETNGTHQLGVYADVSSLVENINIITKNKEAHQMLVEKSKCRERQANVHVSSPDYKIHEESNRKLRT
jgi:hypothetical protein